MPKIYKPPFTQSIAAAGVEFNDTTGTTIVDILVAGAEGGLIKSLVATSTETAGAKVVRLYRKPSGGSDRLIGAVSIPLNAGFDGVVARVDLISATLMPGSPQDAAMKFQILLAPGEALRACLAANASAGKIITVSASGENY